MVQEPVWLWKIHQKNIALGQKKKKKGADLIKLLKNKKRENIIRVQVSRYASRVDR